MAFKSKEQLKQDLKSASNAIIHKPQRKWRDKVEDLIDNFIDSVYDMAQYVTKTQFDERVVAQKNIQFTILPAASLSVFRNTFTSGSGATADFDKGELKLDTGTNPSGNIKVVTRERSEYIAGSEMEQGTGIRISGSLTGSNFVEWGIHDGENGFGWRYDAGGWAVFTIKDSTKTYVSQSQWNEDKLDGAGESGIELDPTTGSIYLNKFGWYGYGESGWKVALRYEGADAINRHPAVQTAHVERIFKDGASVYNPNLPITVEANNGGTSGSFSVYVGGRQVSIYNAEPKLPRRDIVQNIDNHTLTVSQNEWEPIIAIRNSDTFQGQKNSINIRLREVDIKTDQNIEVKTTYDVDLSGSTWQTPDTYNTNETAAEVSLTGSITTGSFGGYQTRPYMYVQGVGGKIKNVGDNEQTSIAVGAGNLVIWVKPTTTTSTTISTAIDWTESF